jgi:hypothetical protein
MLIGPRRALIAGDPRVREAKIGATDNVLAVERAEAERFAGSVEHLAHELEVASKELAQVDRRISAGRASALRQRSEVQRRKDGLVARLEEAKAAA